MEEGKIRSRKPIRSVNNGSRSPHGSPNTSRRQDIRHMSPDFSGSDREYTPEAMYEQDSDRDVSSSTMNSSADTPDGKRVIITSRNHLNIKYDKNGTREINLTQNFRKEIVQSESGTHSNIYWLCLLCLAVSIILGLYYTSKLLKSEIEVEATGRIQCHFDYHQRFPNQDKMLWKSLKHGVEHVLNEQPTSPSIFLLAYHDTASANTITKQIVKKTTECMQSQVSAVELSSNDLKSKEMRTDYGIVITKYKKKLAESGVMLVKDLNKVPFEVAQAFHTFCDVHNPLVDRSIIFLTVQLAHEIHSNYNFMPLQMVENYLRSNWSELESFILDPLITRVTEHVFLLNKE